MKEPKNIQNIKSFLSAIDKMNPNFKNQTNHRKYQKQKGNYIKKMNQTEEFTNQNLSKNENNFEYNIIYQTNNNNNNSRNNPISLHKNTQNNFMHKRSLSKNIFNNINMNNFNTMNKKSNISLENKNNNSKEKNNNPIVFINKSKGIVLNKVNIFKNVKFRKPSLSKHINKTNKIESKINSNSINNTNSNTNTIVQSLSSLNMTSTDVTTSTKRIKDNNIFNIDNKLNKEKENNREMNILRNNNYSMNYNQNNESNTIEIIKNKKQNINKNLFNITNINPNNPIFTNFNTNNTNTSNANSLYLFYKGILPKTNNLLNKTKKPKNINLSLKNSKKNNTPQKSKNLKKKRSSSQYYFCDASKKVIKTKKNISLNTISNNISKKEDWGGTIISDDSVFNVSKRRSSSGTHNDSSKISKGSGTISFDKKSKSISIDYTYSDDEVQTNRRKKGNQLQIDDTDKNLDINKKINMKDNDVNMNNNEFKNFCDDLSSKLFGNKI